MGKVTRLLLWIGIYFSSTIDTGHAVKTNLFDRLSMKRRQHVPIITSWSYSLDLVGTGIICLESGRYYLYSAGYRSHSHNYLADKSSVQEKLGYFRF